MRAVFAAIGFLAAQHNIISTTSNTRPLAVIVSATASKDVWGSVPWPWIFAPLYKWLLGAPHDEKMRMEEVVYRDAGQHLRGFIIRELGLVSFCYAPTLTWLCSSSSNLNGWS